MEMIMRADLNRRRAISILAAGFALPALARAASATAVTPFRWQGIALGASADLTLYAEDRAAAADALAAALAEIARLEGIFSLHQPDSALSRLNREGRLDAAPFELRELLSQALNLAAASDGRFDDWVLEYGQMPSFWSAAGRDAAVMARRSVKDLPQAATEDPAQVQARRRAVRDELVKPVTDVLWTAN